MTKFNNAESLKDIYYLSSPSMSEDEEKVYYVQTSINEKKDGYQSTIIEHNLNDNTEKIVIDNGFINKSPLLFKNKLYFLSNINGTFQIHVYNLSDQTISQLTNVVDNVQSITLNKPNKTLLFTTLVSKEVSTYKQSYLESTSKAIYYRFDKLKYQADSGGFINNSKINYICEYSIDSGEIVNLFPQTTGYGLRRKVSVSEDGNEYLFEQLLDSKSDYNSDSALYIYNRENSKTKSIINDYSAGIFSEGAFSPDSNYIAFLGNPLPYETSNQFKLYLYDRKQNSMKNILDNLDIQFGDNSVSDIYQNIDKPFIQWHPNGQSFFVMSSEYGQVFLNEVSLIGGIKKISPSKSVVKEYLVTSSGDIIATISKPHKPIGLFRYSEGEWQEIPTEVSEHNSKYHYSDYIEVDTKAKDGGVIHGFMVLPPDFDTTKQYPLILNIHGGPYTMHAWNFYHETNYLAANGYIVLLINPRGSYGYGQKHTKGVYERYGMEDYTDLMTSVDFVLSEYEYIDKERLFVTGGSYGGYMTNWIVTQNNRFKAAVSQRSMSNFVSMFGTSDIGYFFYKAEMGLDISTPEKLWERSPLAYVNQVQTPILLIHSKDDLRCQFEQAQQFYTGLKHFQKEAELLVFPDSSHELSRSGRPSYRIARLEAILEWFERYKN